MEISLQLHPVNTWPLKGIIIQDASVTHWFREIQRMELIPEKLTIYPIAGTQANVIWGCFILTDQLVPSELLEQNQRCQQAHPNLFIPEKTTLFPHLSEEEMQQFFGQNKWFFHPETGLTEFREPLLPETVFTGNISDTIAFQRPEQGVHRPSSIRSFQIQPAPVEKVLDELEEANFTGSKPLKDEPLNRLEKLRLGFYRLLNRKAKTGNESGGSGVGSTNNTFKDSFWNKLMRSLGIEKLANKMRLDMDELERRNEKAIDRLMELFKKNPLEALRYAMPLDEGGTARGTNPGALDFSNRWGLFSGNSGSGGSTTISSDHYQRLRDQYNRQAQEFISKGDYKNAAFIYLKLLKSPFDAAKTLEEGKMYQEAAALFLDKRIDNKERAAICYEKGKMYTNAISLYEELKQHKKAADLLVLTGNSESAHHHYLQHIDQLIRQQKYNEAALSYKNDLNNHSLARSTWLEGWKQKKDAVNCLKEYFITENDPKERALESQRLAANLEEARTTEFIRVIDYLFQQKDEQQEAYRELAFQVVAENVGQQPNLVEQLRPFNKHNKHFTKETLRFIQWKRNTK